MLMGVLRVEDEGALVVVVVAAVLLVVLTVLDEGVANEGVGSRGGSAND